MLCNSGINTNRLCSYSMENKRLVQEYVDKKHLQSNGSCGVLVTSLIFDLGIEYKELLPILGELYAEKKIITREGINGKMIFKK